MTPAPATTYDFSGPPENLKAAAREGDVSAVRAAADWFRERGQRRDDMDPNHRLADGELTYYLECLAVEMDSLNVLGRGLHTLLQKIAPIIVGQHRPAELRTRRPISDNELHELLFHHGLPFIGVNRDPSTGLPLSEDEHRGNRRTYTINCYPLDEPLRQETQELLRSFVRYFYPRAKVNANFAYQFRFGISARGAGLLGFQGNRDPRHPAPPVQMFSL